MKNALRIAWLNLTLSLLAAPTFAIDTTITAHCLECILKNSPVPGTVTCPIDATKNWGMDCTFCGNSAALFCETYLCPRNVCIDPSCAKSPFDREKLATAAKEAYDKVKDGSCIYSDELKQSLFSVFDKKLLITCDPTMPRDHMGYAKGKGHPNKISIGPSALSQSQVPLAATILHEAVHRTQWFPDDPESETTAYSCETSCFDVDYAGFQYSALDCK